MGFMHVPKRREPRGRAREKGADGKAQEKGADGRARGERTDEMAGGEGQREGPGVSRGLGEGYSSSVRSFARME